MTVVSLVRVEKSYGSWPVLQGADLEVPDRARIGIVGPNGAGKSTILRILQGDEAPTGGEVVRRKDLVIAYLQQHADGDERTAEQTVLAARPDIAALDAEMRAVEAELGRPEVVSDLARMDRVLTRQQDLLDRWVAAGGAGLAGEAKATLGSLGLEGTDLSVATSSLSGGQRKLVALAACLFRQPDLLLLDEPETHLDADRRARLESIVAEFPGAVVTVSHDRYLLDETVSRIAEVEGGRITMWPGNYSAYAVAKEIALKRQQQLYVTQQKEIARLEEAVKRFEHWARIVVDKRHITQARNKQRQIDRMDKVDKPVFERRKIALEMRAAERGGAKVVELRDVTVAFDGHPVLLGCDLQVFRGERIGVIGANGAGKSVLGSVLAGRRDPDEGTRWAGPSVKVGYLAQGHETEPPDRTPIQFVRDMKPMYEEDAVALLGRFLFRYDQMRQPVGSLSGGERTRLQLCLLMLSGANCLLLDEPTNHLDIDSMEVLESALESYDGTAIVISHDRYLLDRIPDR
ncbi:MAG TPA: ABC-F family ATP-binding cassette domain-containing protein, partial [Actinomycetota bacterium]|nr:ABC-F family ATP-binding cassette domain-containing protein [Actinomycetota bacterium]